jgi:transcriptional regulator GlxA family with amidase domain
LNRQEPNILLEGFCTFFSRIPAPAENAPFSQEALETAILQLKASMPVEEFQNKCFYFRKIADLLPSTETAIPKPLTISEKRLCKIQDFLKENYTKNIQLSDIASQIGLSEEALCRFFKKHTSQTLFAYMNKMRIEASVQMLRETDDSISGIAYSCGFNTICHFNKLFKQSKGMTPMRYREMIQSEP